MVDLRTEVSSSIPGSANILGLMVVISTGFIPLTPLSTVWTMATWESSQWLEKNIVQITGN